MIAVLGRRAAGIAYLLLPVLLAWLCVAVYQEKFTRSVTVTVETGAAGNEMRPHADVKLRGVIVGEVKSISADGDGARLTLAIQPSKIDDIPADVTAQMLPTTLFGERYVALVPTAQAAPPGQAPPGRSGPVAQPLAAGSVITQDRSADAVELQQVLDNILPLLTAVKPEKLSATLSAVATALSGRGTQIGTTLVTLDSYLKKLNPELPQLNDDFHQLVRVSKDYARSAPDILQALTDFTTTTRTIAEQQVPLELAYGTTTTSAQDVTTFLRQNRDNIIRLAVNGKPTLRLLAAYSPEFPCTLRTLAGLVPAMDKALGKGTSQHGLHVHVTAVPSRGRYVPGRDTPSYGATGGPTCSSQPYRGVPNSEQENSLVNELMAPAAHTGAADLPNWSSLLAGPVLRGTEVTVG